jgi:outer membrane receptor protein involved in Fe transport
MHTTHTALSIACVLLLAITAAAADSLEPIDEVTVTATRRATALDEVSIAVSTIDRAAALENKLATDALEESLGVMLQQTTPGQGAAIIRGLKGSAVLHLVDGVRLSNAMFRTAPTPWFALVPTTSIERIEVIRGTPASLYGSEAVGGVIQSVSHLPHFGGDTTDYAGNVILGLDSADLQRSLRATLDAGTRRLAASFGAEYLDTGDRRTGGGERIGPSGYSARAARAVVRGRPTDERAWYIDLHYLEQPETPRVDELVPGFGQSEPSSSEFVFAPNKRVFAHVQHEHLSSSGIDWKFDAAWQRIVDDRRTRNFGADERRFETNRSDLYGLTLDAAGARDDLNWIAGVDVYHDEVRSRRVARSLADGTTTPLAPRFPDGSTIAHGGIFGRIEWTPQDRHRLSSGLRYTDVRIDLPDGTRITPGRLSGDVGWIFDATDHWQVVANIGSGFRAPNIADLGTLGDRPGNRFNIPNSALDAESVTHVDLGMRYFDTGWRVEVVGWALRYRDRIVSVGTGNTTTDGRDIVQSVNAASSTLHGLEAGLVTDLSARVQIEARLSYTRGTQRVAGAEEPGDRIPPLHGRVIVRFEPLQTWQFESWLAAATGQDRLSDRDVRDVRIDPAGTPGWAILGASARWYSSAGWSAALAVDNLFDTRYRVHGSGIDAPGSNVSLTIRRSW